MRTTRFTEEQIAFALRQAEQGTSVEEIVTVAVISLLLRASATRQRRWGQIACGPDRSVGSPGCGSMSLDRELI